MAKNLQNNEMGFLNSSFKLISLLKFLFWFQTNIIYIWKKKRMRYNAKLKILVTRANGFSIGFFNTFKKQTKCVFQAPPTYELQITTFQTGRLNVLMCDIVRC